MCRLLEVLHDPQHGPGDIVKLVKLDVSLAASTLRLANSAAYVSRGGPVASIDRAIVLMGEAAIVRLVTARMMDCLRIESLPGYQTDGAVLFERSIRTAFAGEACAVRTAITTPPIGYTAGLLLDIGKIGLGPYLAIKLEEVLEEVGDAEKPFDEAERAVLGIDHAVVGAHMAQTWGIPAPICAAIRYHHRPTLADDHKPLVYMEHVADMIAGPTDAVDAYYYRPAADWPDHVPLQEQELELVAIDVAAATQQLVDAMANG